MCIWGKKRKWGEEKLRTEKREKKKSEREINKIIHGRDTVTVYIYTVTVARVKIYTFLHNFRSTNVEHFWSKMCKICVFFYFTSTYVDALKLPKETERAVEFELDQPIRSYWKCCGIVPELQAQTLYIKTGIKGYLLGCFKLWSGLTWEIQIHSQKAKANHQWFMLRY